MARRAGIYFAQRTKELMARLTPENATKGVGTAMARLAPLFWREAVARTPNPTGFMRRSWAAKPGPSGVALGNTAAYAGFVEDGTKPHVIAPRNGKVLCWRTGGRGPVSAYNAKVVRSGGQAGALHRGNFAFARVVHHPGTKAQRIVPRMLKAVQLVMGKTVLNALTEAFRGQSTPNA